MRLLYLMTYAGPEKAASNYLGKNRNDAFLKEGWQIELYAPTPSRGLSPLEIKKYRRSEYRDYWVMGGMHVHKFLLCREGKSPVARFFRYLICSVKQFNRGIFASDARSCDVLFTNSTPPLQGVVAALVKKVRHIPFVYNLQDIFPDSLVGTGLAKKGGFLWRVGRMIENFTYRNADKIIVISEDFKKNIMAKGVPEDKIVVIYNWVDEQAVVDVPRSENKLFDKYSLDRSKFYITYCGNIGLTQNMDMLLDIMDDFQTEAPQVQLVLVGDGAYRTTVEQRIGGVPCEDGSIRGTSLPNVVILPFQPYEDISQVFSLGDAGLVISKPGVGENSVPSKTWSIMSASRPVLASFDENEIKDIINENCCGIFTKAGNFDAFKNSILELYHSPEKCRTFGRCGRQFVMDNLTKEVGTSKYVEVIKGFEK